MPGNLVRPPGPTWDDPGDSVSAAPGFFFGQDEGSAHVAAPRTGHRLDRHGWLSRAAASTPSRPGPPVCHAAAMHHGRARSNPARRSVGSASSRAAAWLASACSVLVGCGAARPAPRAGLAGEADVAAVLDDWHAAAAASDEARYFAHFAADGVFLGTDATERWDVAAFRAYAHRPFSEGRGWVMRATRRALRLDGDLAWFDEDLETVNLGPARGTGVLRHEGDGRWRIVHYNLTVTVPNERFDEVRALLQSSPPRL